VARKFRPLVGGLIEQLPPGCPGCVFWETAEPLAPRCGERCDGELARAWIDRVNDEWGDCGRIAVVDGEVLGFIKYAPASLVPQAQVMPAGPPNQRAVLIMCMHITPEARQRGLGKLLMQAALRDLVTRGERTVQAYATTSRTDYALSPVVGVEFLLRMGFTVAKPHPTMPLMQLDLRSLAAWTENLEVVLESLRLPLRVPQRTPVPNIRQKGSA
jgi:GNAT superfamily N-acetyltransferase